MSKITLSEALDLVAVSRSKLYQDAADGTISTEKNKQGTKVVDVAELERVYGKHRNPEVDNASPKRAVADTQNRLMERVRTHPILYIPLDNLTIFTDSENYYLLDDTHLL